MTVALNESDIENSINKPKPVFEEFFKDFTMKWFYYTQIFISSSLFVSTKPSFIELLIE